ncbi:hypothetical protein L5515_016447 [Caenorhabditis briggsae]|uniref:Uncharacterized protein n=1 Tax=Caenorhabditis briggsae TaxID=6238 RepID=A0AAE8ZRY0_CAEBR|nr:hypothetical protein L3Y34_010564 [Caenorhabditis briggsae]UMM39362.1 hypothetical protein L5515_016447 [Caenorhabditis briggsae]
MSDNEKKVVLLKTKKSMSWIRNELFGPIQEAARKPYPFTIDPTTCWCNLSELRLCMLIVEKKPLGYRRAMYKLELVERIKKIFDNEDPSCKIFLSDENQVAFDEQRKQLENGTTKRMMFPPKYTVRPTLEMLDEKLNEWFNLDICERNEPIPKGEFGFDDYNLPAHLLAQIPPDYAPDVEGEHPLAFMDRRRKEEKEEQEESEDDDAAQCSSSKS